MGIQLVTGWRDPAQIQERYGRQRAATIFNNPPRRRRPVGIKDSATLEYVSGLAAANPTPA